MDFLSGRKQRVKLKYDCFSESELVPAGVPQGTKLGPWLFLIMINDLKLQNEMWKFVDDTTVSEVIGKDQTSNLQNQMDILANSISSDKFQLNESKCKEMRICFGSNINDFQPITINNITLEIVQNAKVLGLHIANNFKWNIHVNEVIKKCRKRLYHLTQLKRANIGLKELLQFYKSCIRPVLEYACPVFHNSLTLYLSNDLESVQKRALKIILPHHNYENALKFTNLQRLSERRNDLTTKLFQKIVADPSHRLHGHLPPRLEHLNMELRTQHLFNINFNTKRFRNSFITYNSLKM